MSEDVSAYDTGGDVVGDVSSDRDVGGVSPDMSADASDTTALPEDVSGGDDAAQPVDDAADWPEDVADETEAGETAEDSADPPEADLPEDSADETEAGETTEDSADPPEADLPEDVDLGEAFDAVPEDRRPAVREAFEQCPDDIRRQVLDHSDNLTVKDAEGDDISHYMPGTGEISMARDMEDAEYGEVFRHEYGHYVDDQLGRLSDTPEFVDAVETDRQLYDRTTPEGRERFDAMMGDAFRTDESGQMAAEDMYVSDNLSGLFRNDPEVAARYQAEGAQQWRHPDEYWARPGSREHEIFANTFGARVSGDATTGSFMTRHMPNTSAVFDDMMRR
jgi:hypothetical protein